MTVINQSAFLAEIFYHILFTLQEKIIYKFFKGLGLGAQGLVFKICALRPVPSALIKIFFFHNEIEFAIIYGINFFYLCYRDLKN